MRPYPTSRLNEEKLTVQWTSYFLYPDEDQNVGDGTHTKEEDQSTARVMFYVTFNIVNAVLRYTYDRNGNSSCPSGTERSICFQSVGRLEEQ